jgi:hypothetical protein
MLQPQLPQSLYYSTIGRLVNDVLSRVLEEIEGQEDISEEESRRLNQLSKGMHSLENLFVQDGQACRSFLCH